MWSGLVKNEVLKEGLSVSSLGMILSLEHLVKLQASKEWLELGAVPGLWHESEGQLKLVPVAQKPEGTVCELCGSQLQPQGNLGQGVLCGMGLCVLLGTHLGLWATPWSLFGSVTRGCSAPWSTSLELPQPGELPFLCSSSFREALFSRMLTRWH